MGNKDKVFTENSQGGGHSFYRSRCATFEKKHLGKCLASTDGCFECGKKTHKMRDFPNLKEKGIEVNQDPQGCLDPNVPKRNRFYALGQEEKTNVE